MFKPEINSLFIYNNLDQICQEIESGARNLADITSAIGKDLFATGRDHWGNLYEIDEHDRQILRKCIAAKENYYKSHPDKVSKTFLSLFKLRDNSIRDDYYDIWRARKLLDRNVLMNKKSLVECGGLDEISYLIDVVCKSMPDRESVCNSLLEFTEDFNVQRWLTLEGATAAKANEHSEWQRKIKGMVERGDIGPIETMIPLLSRELEAKRGDLKQEEVEQKICNYLLLLAIQSERPNPALCRRLQERGANIHKSLSIRPHMQLNAAQSSIVNALKAFQDPLHPDSQKWIVNHGTNQELDRLINLLNRPNASTDLLRLALSEEKPFLERCLLLRNKYKANMPEIHPATDGQRFVLQGLAAYQNPDAPQSANWLFLHGTAAHKIAILDKLGDSTKLLKIALAEEHPDPTLCRWLLTKGAKLEGAGELNSWLQLFQVKPEVTKESLDNLALKQGMGYKAANLVLIDLQANAMNRQVTHCEVKVPPLCPITDREIADHIKKFDPEIFTMWEKFQKECSDFEYLKEISERARKVFQDHPYDSPLLHEWVKENPGRLIIRSSGKEDSDTISNAGGNETVPLVKGDLSSINDAIGTVVGSYFGERSIRQRLMAKDASLSDGPPFLPVLVQTMVMEEKEPLTSGVLFTRPEPDFPELITIQAGLGNNHGIVSCKVMVDTYQVCGNRTHAIVRDKEERYAHVPAGEGNYTLEKVENSAEHAKKEALSQGVIQDLAKTATYIASSKVHGDGQKKSMDMEYTLKKREGQKPTLYILQARPLDAPGIEKPKATYVDTTNAQDTVQGKTLLFGGSWVRTINSEKEVIFADDLPAALHFYEQLSDKTGIKGVVIRKTAPLTSHEGVVFRTTGLPVIVIENAQAFEKAKSLVSKNTPVLLSPQNSETFVAAANLKGDCIKEGLVTFPSEMEASVGSLPDLPKVEQLHAKLSKQLLHGRELPKKGETPSLHALVQTIASQDKESAEFALATLLKLLRGQVKTSVESLTKESPEFEKSAVMEMVSAYGAILETTEKELIAALEKPPGTLERLFPLKRVEALIFQSHSPHIVNGVSFANSLSTIKTARTLPKEVGAATQLLTYYKKGAASEETGARWEQFVLNLQKSSPESIMKLKEITNKLDEMQLTGIWINLTFKSGCDISHPVELLADIEAQMEKNRAAFDWTRKEIKGVEECERQEREWENPSFCKKNIDSLHGVYKNWFFPKENSALKVQYEKADQLGKLAILQFMGRAVNSYDRTIKSMKGSTQIDIKTKTVYFTQFLNTYFEMMESAFHLKPNMNVGPYTLLEFAEKLHKGTTVTQGGGWGFEGGGFAFQPGYDSLIQTDWLNMSEQSLTYNFTPDPTFNVAPFLIGAKADLEFNIDWPGRLESYFTLFHQNLETLKNTLMNECGVNEELLAPTVKQRINELKANVDRVTLSSIRQAGENIEITFNQSLLQHACTITFQYDPNNLKKGMEMKVAAYGNNEQDRWGNLATFLSVLGNIPGVSLAQFPKIEQRGCEVNLHIDAGFDKFPLFCKTFSQCTKEMIQPIPGLDSFILSALKQFVDPLPANHRELTYRFNNAVLTQKMEYLNPITTREAKEIAISTIKGMAAQGIPADSENSYYEENFYRTTYQAPAGAPFPKFDKISQKPLEGAAACLCQLLYQGHIEAKDLQILLSDPDVVKKYPATAELLTKAIAFKQSGNS